ncbi:MAG TPA: hypothetical protein VK424_08705 [Thermoplasmata archaeon]|nr:hypothetical protein [Thermoplasmata archaeon]
MATALKNLPRFLVLEPVSTVRLEIELAGPACEIHVELENPEAGRSFVLLIGHRDGPYVQRVRLSGGARIHFDPQSPGEYVLLLANPNRSPLVLRLKAKDLGAPRVSARGGKKKRAKPLLTRRKGRTAPRRSSPHVPAYGSDKATDPGL